MMSSTVMSTERVQSTVSNAHISFHASHTTCLLTFGHKIFGHKTFGHTKHSAPFGKK